MSEKEKESKCPIDMTANEAIRLPLLGAEIAELRSEAASATRLKTSRKSKVKHVVRLNNEKLCLMEPYLKLSR